MFINNRNEYWIDGEKNFPKGSLTMVSEKNYTSGLVDVKIIINGHLFASIVTVSNLYYGGGSMRFFGLGSSA